MSSTRSLEETLRLHFGTAASTVGAQLYAVEKANDGNPGLHRSDGTPRVITFEAKGRIHRKISATQAIHRDRLPQAPTSAWNGGVQVYDQAATAVSHVPSTAHWNWDHFSDKNLVEVEEFRPHMPLHNVYDGQSVSRDGSLSHSTMDRIEDRLRSVLEECDNLRIVENFVDMDSAWAGLSLEVLTYLNEECPSAVVATFGNDWNYPLTDQSDANLYSAGIESRDPSKIEARRRINLLSSVAMHIENSSVFTPVALSKQTRQYTLQDAGSALISAATKAAMTIEVALSEFRATPNATVYGLLEGIVPSTKIFELSARYPLTEDPVTLLDETTASSKHEVAQWTQNSLLPRYPTQRLRPAFSSSASSLPVADLPPRFRRVHFRGDFGARASSLEGALARFATENTVAHWTHEPLCVQTDVVDAVSQLTLSHAVGSYLHDLATQTCRNDRRILYEFTQAGMNVDAVEEFQATLRHLSEAYPSHKRVESDMSDEDNDA